MASDPASYSFPPQKTELEHERGSSENKNAVQQFSAKRSFAILFSKLLLLERPPRFSDTV
jgi:hypothetical protein